MAKLDLKEIIDVLSEDIYLETGIRLREGELKLNLEAQSIGLALYNIPCSKIDFEDEYQDYSEEELAQFIFEEAGDIKRLVIEAKIAQLEKSKPVWLKNVTEELAHKIDNPAELDFSIENGGYSYKHYATEEESESGFPDIVLAVSGPEGLFLEYPLNIYYPDEPIGDGAELITLIIRAIK